MGVPYYERLSEADRAIGWERAVTAILAVAFAVSGLSYVERVRRPLPHIDARTAERLPVERLHQVTPDEIDARAFAREVSLRMFQRNAVTVRESQAWLLSHMTPDLAGRIEETAKEIVTVTQERLAGEIVATVETVTVISEGVGAFVVEVTVAREYLGGYQPPPGVGRVDPENARRVMYRYGLELVPTAKTDGNPYALLLGGLWQVQVVDDTERKRP